LYILYINTHFQTTLFLFSFCENIFPMNGCLPSFSLPFPSLLSILRKHKWVRVFSIRFRHPIYIFFSFFSVFLALMYVCRRQMRVYIQKKRLGVRKTNTHTHTTERERMVLLLLNTTLLFFPLFFWLALGEKKSRIEHFESKQKKKVRRILFLFLAVVSAYILFFCHSFHCKEKKK